MSLISVREICLLFYDLNIRWSNCFSIEITPGCFFIKDIFKYWPSFWWWGNFKLFSIFV